MTISGIAILYRTPRKRTPSTFSFMTPFANEVWIWLGLAYVFVALSCYCLARICPSEWVNIIMLTMLAFHLTMKVFNFTFRTIRFRASTSQLFLKHSLVYKMHFGLPVWTFKRFCFSQNCFLFNNVVTFIFNKAGALLMQGCEVEVKYATF